MAHLGGVGSPSVVSADMSETAQPVTLSTRSAAAPGPPLDPADARKAIRAAEAALLDDRRELSAAEIAKSSMEIAAKICIYTNSNFHFEELG